MGKALPKRVAYEKARKGLRQEADPALALVHAKLALRMLVYRPYGSMSSGRAITALKATIAALGGLP